MALRTIITEPNKILRQVSKPVEKVGDEERKLMRDMLETMYQANGIGLAAIQIGVPKRIIVMDISKDNEKKDPKYFINPIIFRFKIINSLFFLIAWDIKISLSSFADMILLSIKIDCPFFNALCISII